MQMIRTQAVISLVFALLLIATPLVAHAQLLWSGILDPSRAIDWSRTNPGVEGGIPNRTFICATLNPGTTDRKSTRLNSSHGYISYAVFCLKKKNTTRREPWSQWNCSAPRSDP